MLSAEMNERLTRVGPGTPGGELMRRYWQPFIPAAKLEENPVQKTRILCEDLVVYKDRSGNYGLIGDHCAHRLVGMEYGIPDEHGIRCPYHGWCYDETGACVDTPLEPKTSRLKDNVHLKGYPVKEMGGLLFTYMGPGEPPLLPPFELYVWPNAIRQIGSSVIDCNWLQCNENLSDPAHAIWCHGHFFEYVLEQQGRTDPKSLERLAELRQGRNAQRREKGFSHVIFELDKFGLQKACVFKKELGAADDVAEWHSPTIFPHIVRVGGAASMTQEYQIRVPIDDTHTWHIDYEIYMAPTEVPVEPQKVVPYYEAPIWDENGKAVLDYVLSQDMVCWWSQGELTDRTIEHLGVTDAAIVQFRNLLDEQMKIVEAGGDPMNTWRDPAEMGEILLQDPPLGANWSLDTVRKYTRVYENNSDRYGPLMDEVTKLTERVEDFYKVTTNS